MASRRGKGEGTIYQRRDGRWEASVTLDAKNGKRQRKRFYDKTRAGAARKLRDALKRQDDNLPQPNERLTVAAFLRQWLEGKSNLRAESRRRYRDSIELHLIPQLGKKPLAKLTPADLQACYAALASRGLSGTTCAHAHGVFHAALGDAARWSLVVRNVADLVSGPRRSTPEVPTLTPEEAARLLLAAQGDPLEAFYTVALTCGLRLGELQGLRWRDVDLERGRLRVSATLAGVAEGRPILAPPKTTRSRREVYLSEMAVAALHHHRVRQLEQRVEVGQHWVDSDLIFCNTFGRPLDGNNLRERSFKRLLSRAGLPHMRFHDLRHAAASLLMAEGVPIKVISEALGHSDITVTLKVYAHLMPGAQQEAATAMDRLFGPEK